MMKLDGWKYHYFKSVGVSMMVHGCGVTNFHHFYNKKLRIYMLPCSYLGSYEGEKENVLLK